MVQQTVESDIQRVDQNTVINIDRDSYIGMKSEGDLGQVV